MGVALELKCVIETNLIRGYRYISCYLHFNIPLDSCTQATRWNASVIKVGVVCVGLHVLRLLKEGLSWAINKRLQVISNKTLFKTVIPLRN